jgi:hypothetical protein
MGAAAESVSLEKEAPSRSQERGVQQTASAESGSASNPLVERLFQGSPPDPADSTARSLSSPGLRAPVL